MYQQVSSNACKLGCERSQRGNAIANNGVFTKFRQECQSKYAGGNEGPFALKACQTGIKEGLKLDAQGILLRSQIEEMCANETATSEEALAKKEAEELAMKEAMEKAEKLYAATEAAQKRAEEEAAAAAIAEEKAAADKRAEEEAVRAQLEEEARLKLLKKEQEKEEEEKAKVAAEQAAQAASEKAPETVERKFDEAARSLDAENVESEQPKLRTSN
eukprot:CAMPEP_0184556158 /NCGR_PEP_ID=MMETSP0199_2-20130426/39417_1 /TAXON_ID=1112570 /ORGANISM="Thraustochytrium sp., Strain LLF1b" /LENGTH=216 /DNA_ID=CAMNT_0026952701 /DNA_START=373 /DNA_END=1023 /DNA_ORIENTATION=-